jgi:hypothetical protein
MMKLQHLIWPLAGGALLLAVVLSHAPVNAPAPAADRKFKPPVRTQPAHDTCYL